MRKLKTYKPTRFMADGSSYNRELADLAVNFIGCLKHTKGEWYGQNFDLIDWQPLYFLITTAGNDTNSICYEVHQKAQDILDGRKVDATFYPVIYGADEGDDWTSPKVWKKANPSLGITVDIEKLEAACESARQNPAEENLFRQLRLCQWVKQRRICLPAGYGGGGGSGLP